MRPMSRNMVFLSSDFSTILRIILGKRCNKSAALDAPTKWRFLGAAMTTFRQLSSSRQRNSLRRGPDRALTRERMEFRAAGGAEVPQRIEMIDLKCCADLFHREVWLGIQIDD